MTECEKKSDNDIYYIYYDRVKKETICLIDNLILK